MAGSPAGPRSGHGISDDDVFWDLKRPFERFEGGLEPELLPQLVGHGSWDDALGWQLNKDLLTMPTI